MKDYVIDNMCTLLEVASEKSDSYEKFENDLRCLAVYLWEEQGLSANSLDPEKELKAFSTVTYKDYNKEDYPRNLYDEIEYPDYSEDIDYKLFYCKNIQERERMNLKKSTVEILLISLYHCIDSNPEKELVKNKNALKLLALHLNELGINPLRKNFNALEYLENFHMMTPEKFIKTCREGLERKIVDFIPSHYFVYIEPTT